VLEVSIIEGVVDGRLIILFLQTMHLLRVHAHQLCALVADEVDVDVVGQVSDFGKQHVSGLARVISLIAVLAKIQRFLAALALLLLLHDNLLATTILRAG